MKYRSRWVCFTCCKCFLKERDTHNLKIPDTPVKCNECDDYMVDMGYFFPAPRKRDKKKWKIMQLLARYKYRFDDPDRKDYIETLITGKYKLPPREVEKNIRKDLKIL